MDPHPHEHGNVYGESRYCVYFDAVQLKPHDLQNRIGRPEDVHEGEEEQEADGAGDGATAAPAGTGRGV